VARKTDPITKVVLASGKVRWRFKIDHDRGPNGARRQKTYTYDTKKEAQAERAAIIASKAKGTYIAPTSLTVGTYLTEWLAGKRNIRAGTRRAYADMLKPVIERLGDIELQKLTKSQLDLVVEWLLVDGRRFGKAGGLSPKSVNNVLTQLTSALRSAERQGLIGRNVAALVERPAMTRREMKTWTADEAARFLAYVADDRLAAAWMLTMFGMRRGEVVGLRWSDVDLEAGTLTICKTRVSIGTQTIEEDPKTERGRRTLPLPADVVAALRRLRATQAAERLRVGAGAYTQSGFVVVDELGVPYLPVRWTRTFKRLATGAGLPLIRLHDARHTAGTLMHLRGVPTAVISAWLGHASAAFTMRTYVHSQDEALRAAGDTLRGAFKAV
jgi:integrase